jgi:hypothetical protein
MSGRWRRGARSPRCANLPRMHAAIVSLALLASSQAPASQAPERVLVLELKASGVKPDVARAATTAVAEGIARLPRLKVMTLEELRALTGHEKTKAILGCDTDAACMAELSALADADLVVNGSVGLVGGEISISLTLLEPKRAFVRSRMTGLTDTADKVPQRARVLAAELFGVKLVDAPRFSLPAGQARSFAVMDLSAAGVDKTVAANVTQILSAEIKKVEGATVVSRDDVLAILQLEKDKTLLGCSEDEQCLAELGDALGVERLVIGSVGKLADSYLIALKLISTKKVGVENRITESYQGNEAELLRAIRHAARALLGIEVAGTGTLAASTTVDGARLYVDGAERGTLPGPPIEGLAPGRHSIRISADRHLDQVFDVYVNPSDTTALFVELPRRPDEWYESWVFWTATGTVGTIALAAALAGGGYLIYESTRPHPFSVEAAIPARGAP